MWRSPWQKLIKRSEQIVGYPSSFINIRYLISDELATVAAQVRRLVGTKHPLLKTARYLIGDSQGMAQIRGLLILLVAKTFNLESASINTQQRSISEIMETAHAAISIHRGILNIDFEDNNSSTSWKNDMQFGNKMSTLCGDYLLASVSQALADLRKPEIVDTISQGIGDCIQSAFMTKDIHDEAEYRKFVYLANGSLFSRCCRAAVTLRTDADTSLENDEEVAESWAVRWAELYALCEEVDLLVSHASGGRVKSKILLSRLPVDPAVTVSASDIDLCRGMLAKTRARLAEGHEYIPRRHRQARDVLDEMATLLCQDALSNLNSCR